MATTALTDDKSNIVPILRTLETFLKLGKYELCDRLCQTLLYRFAAFSIGPYISSSSRMLEQERHLTAAGTNGFRVISSGNRLPELEKMMCAISLIPSSHGFTCPVSVHMRQ